MNRGAKLALAIGGAFVAVGAIVLVSAKDANATPAVKPPLPLPEGGETHPDDGVVVVPDHAPDEPASPPAVVPKPSLLTPDELNEINRLLLRWWSAEGADFPASELPPATPRDFGSQAGDLDPVFSARSADAAIAFCQGNCNSATLDPLVRDRVATQALLAALRTWASARALPPAQGASSASSPAPILVTPPGASTPVVVVPPLPAASTPPFVPPQAQPAPQAPLAASPPFGIPPPAPSAGTGPFGIPVPAAPPVVAPAPAPQAGPPVLVAPPSAAPIPPAAPAPAQAASVPSMVPSDTAALVQALLQAEGTNNWKRLEPAVAVWQKSRGLKVDSKFGPKSALTVAAEVGTVPIVRYWPSGAQKDKAVRDYRIALLEIAKVAPEPRASQLKMAAAREQGQAFGSKQPALPDSQRVHLGAA